MVDRRGVARFDDSQRNHTIRQQPKRPTGAAFRRLTATQRDQMSLGLAVKGLLASSAGIAVSQASRQALFDQGLANPLDALLDTSSNRERSSLVNSTTYFFMVASLPKGSIHPYRQKTPPDFIPASNY